MKRVHQPKSHTILGSKIPKYVRAFIEASGFEILDEKRYIYERASDSFDGRSCVYVPKANKVFYFDECR